MQLGRGGRYWSPFQIRENFKCAGGVLANFLRVTLIIVYWTLSLIFMHVWCSYNVSSWIVRCLSQQNSQSFQSTIERHLSHWYHTYTSDCAVWEYCQVFHYFWSPSGPAHSNVSCKCACTRCMYRVHCSLILCRSTSDDCNRKGKLSTKIIIILLL